MQPTGLSSPQFTKGRDRIFAYTDGINEENVVNVVKLAYQTHLKNMQDIQWLFRLYRGEDERIFNRKRSVENDINNKAFVAYYSLIADTKAGLFMQNPITLINRTGKPTKSKKLEILNTYDGLANKFSRDKESSQHAHICGVSYRFIEPDYKFKKGVNNGHAPFKISTLNPENVMFLWGEDTETEPIAQVYITQVPKGIVGQGDLTGETPMNQFINRFTVYTDDFIYEYFENKTDEVKVLPAPSYGMPIIEYITNPFRIGSFERVASLIYMLSKLTSDRVNAIEQVVGAILFGKNIGIPQGDTDEAKKAQEDFRTALKKYMAIWVNDTKENEASLQYVSPNLNQKDTQTLYDNIVDDIISITQIPNSVVNMGGSGNAGATETASGWTNALIDAINSEPYWLEALQRELYITLEICKKQGELIGLEINDIDFGMSRKIFDDKQSAMQTFVGLVNAGVPWSKSAEIANLTVDTNNLEQLMIEWREQEENRVKNNDVPMLDSNGEPLTSNISEQRTENLIETKV